MLGRGRLRVNGEVVLEAKLDGYLVIVYDGRLFMGSGRRVPSWIHRVLGDIGVDVGLVGRRVAYLELYGRCLSPGGYHKKDKYCYRAALVDAAEPYSWASGVDESVLFARSLSLDDRHELAELIGAEKPLSKTMWLSKVPKAMELRRMLSMFQGYEGYVLKLYRDKGHVLPPDYGSKLRGLLEVKVKHGGRGGWP